MKQSLVLSTICFLIVFLFAYTGLSKLTNHSFFHAQLLLFPVLKYAEPLLSWALPFVELIVSVFLIFPRTRLYGLIASLILLILFTVYLTAMVMMGLKLPCACGGVIAHLTWKQHILFNLFFIAATLTGLYFEKKVIQNNSAGLKNSAPLLST